MFEARRLKWLDYLTAAMSAVGAAMIVIIIAVILVDVVGRFVFYAPLVGTPEVVAMSIASIVFLQYPSTVRAGRPIRSTLFPDMLAKRSSRALQWLMALHNLVGAVVFAVILYYLVPFVAKAYSTANFYGVPGRFTFPKWYLFGLLAFSIGVIAFQYLVIAAASFLAALRREPLAPAESARAELS